METLKHLKHLSQINSSKGIRFLTPIAHPGSHCPMHIAVSIAAGIKDMASIVIGARECGYYSRNVPLVSGGKHGKNWVYAMDSNEVVFGCGDGLASAIKKLDATGVQAIALLSTCVPEIIGDDFEGIIRSVQPQVKAKLLYVKVPQFNCNGSTSGGLIFYESMLGLMNKMDTKPRTVNLLGYDPARFRRKYPPKLLSLLHESGIDVRYFFAQEASVADYTKVPEAALNIVFSMHNIRLAQRLEELYGIPYIIFQDLYSTGDWDAAINQIEHALGISIASAFAEERAEAVVLEENIRNQITGQRFIMTFPFRDTLPLAAYLCRLGMIPIVIHADEYNPHNAVWTESILKSGNDPYICHMVNDKADAAILNNLPFDICIGKFKYISDDRPCLQDMSGLMLSYDYKRTTALLKMLITATEHTYGIV